ncbi:MAG: 50S ribosomal protein L9 [Oligoflexales bacterium]
MSQMRLILTSDVPSLGAMGEVVTVRGGYARNFLIPRAKAVVANLSNERELQHQRRVLDKKRQTLLETYRAQAKKLASVSLNVTKQVGEDDRIFGSVTTAELQQMLQAEGYELSKRQIVVPEIKTIGSYDVKIELDRDVDAQIKVWVVAG